DQAEADEAEALVIELDTPGGLLNSTRLIVKRILSSKVPVVVYIAPSGSRAGSAGVFITYASHIAAMAPSTNIGAAHPVQIDGRERTIWDALRDFLDSLARAKWGQKKDQGLDGKQAEPLDAKILNDTVAFVKTMARERNRNAEWAEKSVAESASITEVEALQLKVIELIAKDVEDLLNQIHGRSVALGNVQKTLNTQRVRVVSIPMTFRQQFLNVLANPNIAYFLLLLGFYGLLFEVTHAGSAVPGILGTIFIILAFFSMQMLPTNYAGLALILLGVILFVAEMFITGFGLPTLGGLICMVLGSLLLFESPNELMRVSLSLIFSLTLSTAVITLILVRAVLVSHRRKIQSGEEGLIGESGRAQTDIPAGREGKVFVHGEIWNAVSKQEIRSGELVEVVRVDGMTLEVKRVLSKHA
ncbi:MAG: nodulation protein NfeD, partial [Candidatus Omnitrophica bacterium]|nr:nodulation protein NfeD [Candidatus Omnitrophota bacterium]